jgi:hypothetical protein
LLVQQSQVCNRCLLDLIFSLLPKLLFQTYHVRLHLPAAVRKLRLRTQTSHRISSTFALPCVIAAGRPSYLWRSVIADLERMTST